MKSPKPLASDFREKIEVQRAVRTELDLGEFEEKWDKLFDLWAKIIPKNQMFVSETKEVELVKTYFEVTVRYNSDLEIRDRVLYRGNFYKIEGIINIFQFNKYMKFKMTLGEFAGG